MRLAAGLAAGFAVGKGGAEAGGNGSCIPGGLIRAAKGTLGLRQSGRLGGVRVGGPSECPDEDVLLQVVPAWGGVPGRVLAEQAIIFQAGQRANSMLIMAWYLIRGSAKDGSWVTRVPRYWFHASSQVAPSWTRRYGSERRFLGREAVPMACEGEVAICQSPHTHLARSCGRGGWTAGYAADQAHVALAVPAGPVVVVPRAAALPSMVATAAA